MKRYMPPEWATHARTWMEFPPENETFTGDLEHARAVWMGVARAVARFEPVTMIANIGDGDDAHSLIDHGDQPRYGIEIIERPINDAWFRDSGPTFVVDDDGLGATHWTFNGWGDAGFSEFGDEQHVGRWAAELAGLAPDRVSTSPMVNEGGGFHVDGEGTVLLTDTVQLDPGRNPGWTKEEVEAEIHRQLGTTKAIWLPRGLTRDYERFGTRGHVDIVAAFAYPGVVAVHRQPDPAHPDYEVTAELIGILGSSVDAQGRTLEVVEIEAPTVLSDDDGFVDYSYINHYLCNGAVILCGFGDAHRDLDAVMTMQKLHPHRDVVLIDARGIFAHGGGIHCITQQQPAV